MTAVPLQRIAGDLRAVQRVLPPGAIELACHASLPVAVDPPLLHLIRTNFLPDLPYDLEARLLLSPLFQELGDGLYEIKPDLRDVLLAALVARHGTERLRRVAILLERYTDLRTSWPDRPELAHAQRLTALHVLQPREAERWLAQHEPGSGGDELAPTWFVAMRRQIRSVPARDQGLLSRLLRAATEQLRRPDRPRQVADVLAVVALLGLPGLLAAAVMYALEALRAASADTDPAVRRAARDALPDVEVEVRLDDSDGLGSHRAPTDRPRADGLADPTASRVVLIGNGDLRGRQSLPGIATALQGLADALAEPEIWGIDRRNCQVLLGAGRREVEAALRRAAAEVGPDGLLLVHYAGHGLSDLAEEGLVLGTADTDLLLPRHTGLPYSVVERCLRGSAARQTLVVLDCDHTGQISGSAWFRTAQPVDCLIALQQPALPSPSAGEFPLTRELTRLLWSGIPGAGTLLDAQTIYQQLQPSLPADVHLLLADTNDSRLTPLTRNRVRPTSPLVGRIFSVAPEATDASPYGAVVMVLRHHPLEGTLGVRLDDPFRQKLDLPPEWSGLPAPPAVAFRGGTPAERHGFIAVARLLDDEGLPAGIALLRDRAGVLTRHAAPARIRPYLAGIRLFTGYLGWAPDQFEELLAEGAVWQANQAVAHRLLMTDRPEHLPGRLARASASLRSTDTSRPGLTTLLHDLVASIGRGDSVSLVLGQDAGRPTSAADVDRLVRPGSTTSSGSGITALGSLLAYRGQWFERQVFTIHSAPVVARAVRDEGSESALLHLVADSSLPARSDDAVQVYEVKDHPGQPWPLGREEGDDVRSWTDRTAERLAELITGNHVCVVGHDGAPGVIVAALRRLRKKGLARITWVTASDELSAIRVSREADLDRALGGKVSFYHGVDSDRLFPLLRGRLGAFPPDTPRLGVGVRFPRAEHELLLDLR
ncbi:YqgE/AlgH family protein [Micromonospora sp. NPDC049060]|uniref:YqgE/AlgH family protein n=1 Tax=Micromonospora sp. NPDC049060 TaxID=3154828 RepID=UPI0033D7FF70